MTAPVRRRPSDAQLRDVASTENGLMSAFPHIEPSAIMDNTSTDLISTSHLQTNEVPDTVVESLLGRGLSYLEWRSQLGRKRYLWNEGLKLQIIRKEFLMFKPEIGRMLWEPNTSEEVGPKSNSYIQIMKRMKGKTGDREERLASGTLFGSNGKAHNLERYVEKWRVEDASFGYATDTTQLPEKEYDTATSRDESTSREAEFHDLRSRSTPETHTSTDPLSLQTPVTPPFQTCEASDLPVAEPVSPPPNVESSSKEHDVCITPEPGRQTPSRRQPRSRKFSIETNLRHKISHLDTELRKSKMATKAKDERIQELERRLELLEPQDIQTHRSEGSSPRSSNDMEDAVVHDPLHEETVRQLAHEKIVQKAREEAREARAAKRVSMLQRPSSEIPPSEQEDDKSISAHQRRKFISSKSPVQLDLVASADRTSTISNRLSRNNIKSDVRKRRSSSMRRIVRQASNALLRNKGREETDEAPPLPPNSVKSEDEAVDSDPRDSGYGSFDFWATPRASVINAEYEHYEK